MLVDSIQVLNANGTVSDGITREKILTQPGDLVVFDGRARWYPSTDITVSAIQANVGTPSGGSSITVRLMKNGVIIGTTVDIDAGNNRSAVLDGIDELVTPNDYLTVDVVQVGSVAVPGANLTLGISYLATL